MVGRRRGPGDGRASLPPRILAAPTNYDGQAIEVATGCSISCTLKLHFLFGSMLLPGVLKTFLTLELPSLACMSRFLTFSYSKNACKKVQKGLEVGNGPKGK